MTKNNTEAVSEVQKISFIDSKCYKIYQKSNKKLILLTLNCFLTSTLPCPFTLPFFYFNLSTSVTIILLYNSMSSHDSLSFFPSRNKHILHQIRHDTNLKTHHNGYTISL